MKRIILTLTLALLAGTAWGQHGIDLAWTETGCPSCTFNVYRGTTTGGENYSTPIASTSALTYLDQTGTTGTHYFYTVKANNGTLSAPSSEASAIFPLLSLPTACTSNPALDTYCGITARPIDTATGYFHTKKVSGRWLFVDPLGNAFWTMSVYVDSSAFLETPVGPFTLSSVSVSGSTVTYTGTITSGANNALIADKFQVSGFASPGNNVLFIATGSTATTIVGVLTSQVNETHAGTATDAVPGVNLTKYGGNNSLFTKHQNQRLLSWNFNTIGEYALTYALPVNTNGSHSNANTVKLPFIYLINGNVGVSSSPTTYGLTENPKNIVTGVSNAEITRAGNFYYGGNYLDFWDPNYALGYGNVVAYSNNRILTDGFNASSMSWMLGITSDDTDYMTGLKNRGDSPFVSHPHPVFLDAVACFNWNACPGARVPAPVGHTGPWNFPDLYAKYAWTCGVAGIDFGFGVGKGYLDNKYGTIGALNTAWGTSGFYTSFCDDGGWGTGTGVLDEDGRHTVWIGTDAYNLTNANANVATDMNAFLYLHAKKYETVAIASIRAYDSHHLIFGPASMNAGGEETRPQVLQAMSDAGVDVFQYSAPVTCPGQQLPCSQGTLDGSKASYDLTGKPAFFWYSINANPDSAIYSYPSGIYGDLIYPTQAARSAHYQTDMQSYLSAQGTNGDYYNLGIDWWELTDGGKHEQTNWGLVTDRDNAYDGIEDVNHSVLDSAGIPTIPENYNYGNFTSGVTAGNLNVLNQLLGGGALTITGPPSCPNGYRHSVYPGCFPQAVGGTPPYTWSISAGTLCTGFSQDSGTGAITGTPTAVQSCDFTAKVTDALASTATKEYTPQIFYDVLTITSAPCPMGSNGVLYAGCPQSYTGGNGTNVWTLASGTLPAGLSLNSATGAITGTPTASGTSPFTIQAADTETPPQTAINSESIVITGGSGLHIVAGPVPLGFQNSPYGPLVITATGGTPPYKIHLMGFSFCPAGLTTSGFDVYGGTATIAGTPTANGGCELTATVLDSSVPANNAGQSFSLLIEYPVLKITTSTCPPGTVNAPYTCFFTSTGGNGVNTWSALPNLPPSLAINSSTGEISGTPTSAGIYPLSVTVTDSESPPQIFTQGIGITIAPLGTLSITTSSLPNGTVGTPYSNSVTATGGNSPYSWAVVSGSMCTGLTLSSSGTPSATISGTPSIVQTCPFTVQVTDSLAATATQPLSIIIDPCGPLAVTTTSLPSWDINVPGYSQNLAATCGTPPYSWVVLSGTLPTGMTLSTSGTISGTPTVSGTFPFTVQVTDALSNTAVSNLLSITINPPVPPNATIGVLGAIIMNGAVK